MIANILRFQYFLSKYYIALNITSANTLPEMTSTDVKLMHVVNQTDLVAPSKNFTTHILTCRSCSNILWEINGNSVTSFNENDEIGARNFSLYHLNLSKVEWEAVIVHKEAPKIVSVMIWIDFDSVGTFRVTCRSRMDEAIIAFNPHTTQSYSYIYRSILNKIYSSSVIETELSPNVSYMN